MTVSPWVQNAQTSSLPAKALVDGFAIAIEFTDCDYCGFARSEGAVLVERRGFVLCTTCSKDAVLGACRHGGICDCSAA